MRRVALIDADIVSYVAARVTQRDIDWEDGDDIMVTTDLPVAKKLATETIEKWREASGADDAVLCFTDRRAPQCTFRHTVFPTYKASRKDKPEVFNVLDGWMRSEWESLTFKHCEGDDVIGLTITDPNDLAPHYVSVSTDKDMQTLPGWCFNPTKDKRPRLITEQQANWFWMFQTLTGDAVDEFKGAPGVGKVKAGKVLSPQMPLGQLWNEVLAVYAEQYEHPRWGEKFVTAGPFEEALMNARCARILRHGDYDFRTEEVKLWTP